MRLAVFDDDHLGVVEGDVIADVSTLFPGETTRAGTGPLHRLIESGAAHEVITPGAISGLPRRRVSEVRIGAPLPRPGKIIGAPVNYLDHKAEMSETHSIADLGVFLKAPTSVIGHRGTVRLPYTDKRTDHEGELTVVIGRAGRNIAAADALDYVFGYTCGLDMTVRSTEDRSTRKSFETFAPIGPLVVTADEVPSPGALELTCRVNGQVRQHASVADLIFGIPELIAYASSVMTLWPGDIIMTGTPAGVGPVEDGDQIEVEITGIGTLAVDVSAAGAQDYAKRPGAR